MCLVKLGCMLFHISEFSRLGLSIYSIGNGLFYFIFLKGKPLFNVSNTSLLFETENTETELTFP